MGEMACSAAASYSAAENGNSLCLSVSPIWRRESGHYSSQSRHHLVLLVDHHTSKVLGSDPFARRALREDVNHVSFDLPSSKQEGAAGNQDGDVQNGASPSTVEEAFGLLREEVEEEKKMGLGISSKLLKRSRVIAKQVISQSSAMTIGYVTQIWISVQLCKVVALEVRPSLLSGDIDRVCLADVSQIGDVVLVSDESVLENETKAVDCETLVGYDVITEDGSFVGKVRDYSFDFQDGKLISLDCDAVGFSLVPSSLISTYRLDAEEVIDVLSDSILVRGGAETRIRRLTKGFWQLPSAQEMARSRRMLVRSRRRKKTTAETREMLAPQSRQLPESMRPSSLEESKLDGLDLRREVAERRWPSDGYRGSQQNKSG